MNHISEILSHPNFYNKPFLILGTGPSLDDFKWFEHNDKNIITIYEAVNAADHIFMALWPDSAPTNDNVFIRSMAGSIKYLVTRAYNNGKFNLSWKPLYFEYDCDIANYPNPNHEIPYDGKFHGGDGKRYFPFHIPFPCSNTITFIATFLGMARIKKVYTCGIDGGTEVTKWASEEYREGAKRHVTTFDQENEGFYAACAKYGIETIKL